MGSFGDKSYLKSLDLLEQTGEETRDDSSAWPTQNPLSSVNGDQYKTTLSTSKVKISVNTIKNSFGQGNNN